jgi:hypothetical protein
MIRVREGEKENSVYLARRMEVISTIMRPLSITSCTGGAAIVLGAALLASCGSTAPPKKAAPATVACVPADVGHAGAGHFRFNTSACEDGTNNVTTFTLPLHKGTSHGQTVYYVIMDTSDQALSDSLGVNFAPKLANAKATPGVQVVSLTNSLVDFPGTVSFGHTRVVTPSATGFPPDRAEPPSVGDSQYSPLSSCPTAPSRTPLRSPTAPAWPPRWSAWTRCT